MSYISEQVRQTVAERAFFRCEYCRVREVDSFLGFEIDHIISQKHGGGSEIDNLAYSCPHCNSHKGSDIATFVESYQDLVPLFHPHFQNWQEHFSIDNGKIVGLTKIGQATIKVLKFNTPDRIIQRAILHEANCWP